MLLYFAPYSHLIYFIYNKQIQNGWQFCVYIWKIPVEPNLDVQW